MLEIFQNKIHYPYIIQIPKTRRDVIQYFTWSLSLSDSQKCSVSTCDLHGKSPYADFISSSQGLYIPYEGRIFTSNSQAHFPQIFIWVTCQAHNMHSNQIHPQVSNFKSLRWTVLSSSFKVCFTSYFCLHLPPTLHTDGSMQHIQVLGKMLNSKIDQLPNIRVRVSAFWHSLNH